MSTYTKYSALLLAAILWMCGTTLADGPNKKAPAVELRLADTTLSEAYSRLAHLDSIGKLHLHRDVLLTLDDIAGVKFIRRPGRVTDLQLDIAGDGAKRLAAATQQNIGRKLAIVLDGEVVVAANIMQRIPANVSVSAVFSDATLARLFNALVLAKPHPGNAGPLAPVQEVREPLEAGP
jgi:preprotein translocase subunit SecD